MSSAGSGRMALSRPVSSHGRGSGLDCTVLERRKEDCLVAQGMLVQDCFLDFSRGCCVQKGWALLNTVCGSGSGGQTLWRSLKSPRLGKGGADRQDWGTEVGLGCLGNGDGWEEVCWVLAKRLSRSLKRCALSSPGA